MGHGISYTNIGIILLDVLLVWTCFSFDKHLKLLDLHDLQAEQEDERRFALIPLPPDQTQSYRHQDVRA